MKKLLATILFVSLLLTVLPLSAFAADDWTTLRVEVYDRSIAGFNVEDCMQLRYIQENFGDPNHIKVLFVPVSRWEEGTILSTQLAGGTAPDICMTYGNDMVQQYIDMGGILALDELLSQYGQNLTAFLGESVLQYGQFDTGDGKQQYYLPARRIITATQSTYVRGDWLEKLNMAVPTTVEELEAYFKAAKDNNLGGDMTVPYSSDLYAADPLYGWIYQMDAFIDYDKVTEEDWFAYHKFHAFLPGAKEAFRLMNKWYNQGYVTEFFGLNDADRIKNERVLGYNGYWVGNWDGSWRVEDSFQQEMEKNVDGAYWTTCNVYSNIHETYTAAGQAIFIPGWVDEKVAVAAVKYLDWMSLPENLFFLQNGVEGQNYTTVDENGIPSDIKGIADVQDEYKMHATDVAPICNGYFYGSDELNYAATAKNFPGYEDEVSRSLELSMEGAYEPVSFTKTIQSRIDYGSMVVAKEAEFLVQIVTCKEADFDTKYDEYSKAILDVGGQKIIDEQRAAYQSGDVRGFYPYAEKK